MSGVRASSEEFGELVLGLNTSVLTAQARVLFLSSCSFFFFFIFFFGHPVAHGVPGPGIRSEPQLQPGSSTHCTRLGIKPTSWCCRDTANPDAPQRTLSVLFIFLWSFWMWETDVEGARETLDVGFLQPGHCPPVPLQPSALITWSSMRSLAGEETQPAPWRGTPCEVPLSGRERGQSPVSSVLA